LIFSERKESIGFGVLGHALSPGNVSPMALRRSGRSCVDRCHGGRERFLVGVSADATNDSNSHKESK
jgi:hypothetical protein